MRLIVALYERDIVMTDSALEQILQGVFRFANLFAQKLQLDHSYKTGSSSIAKSHHRRQYQLLPCVVFQIKHVWNLDHLQEAIYLLILSCM
jgi:hypothetical protein